MYTISLRTGQEGVSVGQRSESRQPSQAERILNAAFATFRRGGLVAVSLRGVAADLDVTPMSLYRHYASKEDLIEALVQRGLATLDTAYLGRSVKNAKGTLQGLAKQYVRFALTEPHFYELLFMVRRPSNDPFLRDYERAPSHAFARWRQGVLEATGSTNAHRATTDAIHLWAVLHGYCSLYLSGRFGIGARAFQRLALSRFDHEVQLLRDTNDA